MATSGSTNFDLTRNEIINDALIHCGAIEEGETPSAAGSAFAARQLNRMVKAWEGSGLHLWKRKEVYLFLQASQGRYQVGNSGEHFAYVEDVVRTALASDMSSGAGSIEVDSATGIAASDAIGVVLDDGTIEWDTVSSISDTTITLSGTISGDDAAEDNTVFAYTTKIGRPPRVEACQRTDNSDVDTPIEVISHEEYQRLPNKTHTGLVNEVYYQPELTAGYVYAWPEPDTANDRLRLTCLIPIEDFDASSDTSDLPQEWLDALTWNLAKKLCPSYPVPPDVKADIKQEAKETLDLALRWDQEMAPVEFVLDEMA